MGLQSLIPEFSERDANGIPLTIVDVRGTYHQSQGPMMAQTTAIENYRMLAAVAEGPAGPTFFKLTGPQTHRGSFRGELQLLFRHTPAQPVTADGGFILQVAYHRAGAGGGIAVNGLGIFESRSRVE